MNIFIDTNILLDFYRLSSGDLEELRKIAKLSKVGKIRLFISDFLKDEFFRNREAAISSAIEQFRKSRADLQLPNLVRIYSTAQELINIRDAFVETKEILMEEVQENIRNSSLMADSVIAELFESTDIQKVSKEIITVGTERSSLSKPPGKRDSCGDAVHWEWLLEILPSKEDLFLISRDEDYESPLNPGSLGSYLQDEWKNKKGSRCILYSSLKDFLAEHFPDIKLADEIDKLCAIEQLEKSSDFKTTHDLIQILKKFDDFREQEILRIVNAYITNDQVWRVLGDTDVLEFALKLTDLAQKLKLYGNVESLVEMLEALYPTESGSRAMSIGPRRSRS
jgi:predicted nucleic acid-binding protein